MTKALKDKIFKGGVTSELRPLCWKRILGLVDDDLLNTGLHTTIRFQCYCLENFLNLAIFSF